MRRNDDIYYSKLRRLFLSPCAGTSEAVGVPVVIVLPLGILHSLIEMQYFATCVLVFSC